MVDTRNPRTTSGFYDDPAQAAKKQNLQNMGQIFEDPDFTGENATQFGGVMSALRGFDPSQTAGEMRFNAGILSGHQPFMEQAYQAEQGFNQNQANLQYAKQPFPEETTPEMPKAQPEVPKPKDSTFQPPKQPEPEPPKPEPQQPVVQQPVVQPQPAPGQSVIDAIQKPAQPLPKLPAPIIPTPAPQPVQQPTPAPISQSPGGFPEAEVQAHRQNMENLLANGDANGAYNAAKGLLNKGLITQEEFDDVRARALALEGQQPEQRQQTAPQPLPQLRGGAQKTYDSFVKSPTPNRAKNTKARLASELRNGYMTQEQHDQYVAQIDLLASGRGRALGGPVNENEPYVVGEQGPEIMVPQQSGTVVPNKQPEQQFGFGNFMMDQIKNSQPTTLKPTPQPEVTIPDNEMAEILKRRGMEATPERLAEMRQPSNATLLQQPSVSLPNIAMKSIAAGQKSPAAKEQMRRFFTNKGASSYGLTPEQVQEALRQLDGGSAPAQPAPKPAPAPVQQPAPQPYKQVQEVLKQPAPAPVQQPVDEVALRPSLQKKLNQAVSDPSKAARFKKDADRYLQTGTMTQAQYDSAMSQLGQPADQADQPQAPVQQPTPAPIPQPAPIPTSAPIQQAAPVPATEPEPVVQAPPPEEVALESGKPSMTYEQAKIDGKRRAQNLIEMAKAGQISKEQFEARKQEIMDEVNAYAPPEPEKYDRVIKQVKAPPVQAQPETAPTTAPKPKGPPQPGTPEFEQSAEWQNHLSKGYFTPNVDKHIAKMEQQKQQQARVELPVRLHERGEEAMSNIQQFGDISMWMKERIDTGRPGPWGVGVMRMEDQLQLQDLARNMATVKLLGEGADKFNSEGEFNKMVNAEEDKVFQNLQSGFNQGRAGLEAMLTQQREAAAKLASDRGKAIKEAQEYSSFRDTVGQDIASLTPSRPTYSGGYQDMVQGLGNMGSMFGGQVLNQLAGQVLPGGLGKIAAPVVGGLLKGASPKNIAGGLAKKALPGVVGGIAGPILSDAIGTDWLSDLLGGSKGGGGYQTPGIAGPISQQPRQQQNQYGNIFNALKGIF